MKRINKEKAPAPEHTCPGGILRLHIDLSTLPPKVKALSQAPLAAWPQPKHCRRCLRERKTSALSSLPVLSLFPGGQRIPFPFQPSLPSAPLPLPQLSSEVTPCTYKLFELFFRPAPPCKPPSLGNLLRHTSSCGVPGGDVGRYSLSHVLAQKA